MHKTKLRNGVLIYVATVDRKFAIIGDAGINQVVPADFWDSTKEDMLSHFKYGNLVEGIVTGITKAGGQLKNISRIRWTTKTNCPTISPLWMATKLTLMFKKYY
jgi:uncharacterized membrane protein